MLTVIQLFLLLKSSSRKIKIIYPKWMNWKIQVLDRIKRALRMHLKRILWWSKVAAQELRDLHIVNLRKMFPNQNFKRPILLIQTQRKPKKRGSLSLLSLLTSFMRTSSLAMITTRCGKKYRVLSLNSKKVLQWLSRLMITILSEQFLCLRSSNWELARSSKRLSSSRFKRNLNG